MNLDSGRKWKWLTDPVEARKEKRKTEEVPERNRQRKTRSQKSILLQFKSKPERR